MRRPDRITEGPAFDSRSRHRTTEVRLRAELTNVERKTGPSVTVVPCKLFAQ